MKETIQTVGEAIELEAGHGVSAALHREEVNQQIVTAKRFPRSVSKFMGDVAGLATMSETVAAECTYAIPREGRLIEGPSARLAEIVAHAWGNCRTAARILDDSGDFVVAQGVFMDLEKNVAIGYEVRRRITDRNGRRFSPDMIAVTANAAASIAIRNAIFKGVPKAFWNDAYEKAREVTAGNSETLEQKRYAALEFLSRQYGVKLPRILHALRDSADQPLRGIEDITGEHVLMLRGIITALKEQEVTVEETFPDPNAVPKESATGSAKGVAAVAAAMKPSMLEPVDRSISVGQPKESAGETVRGMCSNPGCVNERALDSQFCDEHKSLTVKSGRK